MLKSPFLRFNRVVSEFRLIPILHHSIYKVITQIVPYFKNAKGRWAWRKKRSKPKKGGLADAGINIKKRPLSAGTSLLGSHPDHSTSKKRINRVKGQLDAVARMIDERKYCPEIIQQIRAATNALRGLETEVLRGHLRGCVKEAMQSKNAFTVNDKIEEILHLFSKTQ